MFGEKWIYRSDITGFGVRGKVDLVFEVERILQLLLGARVNLVPKPLLLLEVKTPLLFYQKSSPK